MSSKEPDARIRIDKMLLEAGLKLPGWAKDEEINVTTEINNESGEADYVLLSSKENHLCTVEAKKTLLSPLVGKEQARGYAKSLNCRFIILSNGILHYLWDLEQGNPVKIEKFPSQEDLEMKTTFNPPRDEDEDDGGGDDDYDYVLRIRPLQEIIINNHKPKFFLSLVERPHTDSAEIIVK